MKTSLSCWAHNKMNGLPCCMSYSWSVFALTLKYNAKYFRLRNGEMNFDDEILHKIEVALLPSSSG